MLPTVAAINALEPQLRELSDIDLAAKTIEFKERIAQGATLDDLLVEAFAVVREAGRRVLNMRHFDVQLIGGMVLHRGKIAEMKTGEGKTLVATLPVLSERARQAKASTSSRSTTTWPARLGVDGPHLQVPRPDASASSSTIWTTRSARTPTTADITYGTNNEFGFDYLRDNMKFRIEDCVQRGHNFAIVDEVDSILIDEARTPLIISGPSEESTDKYYKINRIIPKLMRGEVIEGKEPGEKYTTGDYTVDEKHRSRGAHRRRRAARSRSCSTSAISTTRRTSRCNHHVQQALQAPTCCSSAIRTTWSRTAK